MMRAAVFYGPGDLRVEDVGRPSPGRGEVVVKVEATLTCGTDLKTLRRGHPFIRPPRILGHEYSGVVAEQGDGAAFKVGERVAGVNSGPCFECSFCRRGRENLCETLDRALIGFTTDGSYAEYCRIPSRVARVNLLRLDDRVSFDEASFLEPLSCVVHGLDRVNLSAEVAAIIGGGPIGLMHLQVMKLLAPQTRVTVLDRHAEKLEMARRMGADRTVNIVEESLDGLWETFGLVIEAVGRIESWEMGLRLVEKGGTVLFFGGCPRGTAISLDTYRTHYHELNVLGAFHHTPRDVKKALDLIQSRRLMLREMIQAEMSLENIGEAFEKLQRGEAGKILIRTY